MGVCYSKTKNDTAGGEVELISERGKSFNDFVLPATQILYGTVKDYTSEKSFTVSAYDHFPAFTCAPVRRNVQAICYVKLLGFAVVDASVP